MEVVAIRKAKPQFIVLKVKEDCNLWPYVVMVFNKTDNKHIPSFTYVFESMDVCGGDFIMLSSDNKKNNVSNKNIGGSMTHVFYLGGMPLFNSSKSGYRILIVRISDFCKY